MSLTFRSRFTSVGVLLQRFTWCLLLYDRRAFYDWLRVLMAECTPKFHKLRVAEYTRTGCLRWRSAHLPTSSIHCSRPSRSDGYSDRPPAFQGLVRAATRTTAANEAESEKIVLYSSLSLEIDYELLMAEHTTFCRLRMSGFFCSVRWW